jgi:hypothetical protein
MKQRFFFLALSIIPVALLSACASDEKELRLSGGADNFTIDPKFKDFCAAYDDLNLALNDMTEIGTTKETFKIVLEKSSALVDASPDDIADAVLSNDAILNAMNQAFSDRGYDREKIDADESLRQEVQQLYAQEGLPELASKYADYLVKNCGVSVEAQ